MNNLEEQFNQAEEMFEQGGLGLVNELEFQNEYIPPIEWSQPNYHRRLWVQQAMVMGDDSLFQPRSLDTDQPVYPPSGATGPVGEPGIEGVPGEGLLAQIERAGNRRTYESLTPEMIDDAMREVSRSFLEERELPPGLTKRSRRSKAKKQENQGLFLDNVVKNDSI